MSAIKPIAALLLTGVGAGFVVAFRVPDATAVAALAGTSGAASGTGSGVAGTATSGGAAGTPAGSTSIAAGTTAAQYKDGTYTGIAVQEPWGTFQVQATISGTRLTNVTVISEPGDRHSASINSSAVPLLTQAAIASQGATVDMVSGATWTSKSYATSLQAALDAAKAGVKA